ncbi:MAG: TonB-dependent receptor [Candidatus Thiodiazotropha sp. (ex Dulcina madagascariensis)]|nr:TonB-dependent receptor [Candidatus Thiodiazotropha sp. (ex Dulcina madagascariensis)]
MIGRHRLSLFAFAAACSISALAEEPLISDEQMREAERLFSGPSEEDYYRTDAILVSATGSAKPVFLAPSVASVITKEQIEAMGATTLDEVLETVPGLHVYSSPTLNYQKHWSIRGIHTNSNPQVLLLLNGQPIQDLHQGDRPNSFQLPVSMISRVEVIRGPGSAVHGADAFAGSVNVITKDGQEIGGTQAGLRSGSFSRRDAWAQHGGNYGGWDLAVGIDLLKSDGDDNRVIDRDLQNSLDDSFGTSASLAPRAVDSQYDMINAHIALNQQNWNLRLWGWRERDGGIGAGLANAMSADNRLETDTLLGDVEYSNDQWLQDWTAGFRVSYLYLNTDTYLQLFPPGAVLPIGSDGNLNFTAPAGLTLFTDGYIGHPERTQHHYSAETTALFDGLTQHRMRFALGYRYTEMSYRAAQNWGLGIIDGSQAVVDGSLTDLTGTAGIFMPDVDRSLWYLSAQDEWAFARDWELTLGARYDRYSDFGGTFNPRAALVWQARYNLTTKLLYGRAFRAPGFANLHAQNNPIGLGNPDLEPETMDTLELAFIYLPTVDLRLAANLFAYDIEGLIEFVSDSGEASATAQNAHDQKGHGAELEVDWETTDTLRLMGNLAWHNAEDKATGHPVPGAPRLQAYANAHWRFLPKWSIDGQWSWVGNRQRAAGDTRSEVDDYHIVNLTLRRKQFLNHFDLAVALRNLFDEDVREPGAASSIPNDYPMDSRALWAGLQVNF